MTNAIALVIATMIVALFLLDAGVLHWGLPVLVGRSVAHGVVQHHTITDVADDGFHALRNVRHVEQTRVGWRWQRIACYLSTELLQPQAQPASFETGVPGKEYFFVAPE